MRTQQSLAAALNPAELAKRLTSRPTRRAAEAGATVVNATPAPGRRTTLDRRPAHRTWRLPLNWRWLALVPVLALIAYGVAQLFTSYDFYVYAADIRGNQRVSAQAIYDASGVHKQNIFWVNVQRAADNVASLPGIAKANVQVQLPNRVTINVQERTPLVMWQAADSTIWIDTEGTPMPALGAPPALTLVDAGAAAADGMPDAATDTVGAATGSPLSATNTTSATLASGTTAAVGTLRLRPNVFSALVALHTRRPDLTTIYYGVQEGLYFRAPEGWTVYLGDTGDIAGQLALLESMRSQIAARQTPPTVVDLRVGGNAYLR